MAYFKATLKGVSWSIGTRWVLRVLTFVRLAVLARILVPAQFGVFGIATLALGLLEVLTETWINVFLVQETGEIDKYVDTAWVISLVRGLVIAIIIYFFSPLISQFFNSSESLPVLQLISLVPFIRGFINPSVAQIQKYLRFKFEFGYRSFLFFIDAGIAISLSLMTHQAISLAWGMLAGSLLEVMLSFILFKPRPQFRYLASIASRILNRGKWVTVAGIFSYLYQNGDNIVVARILGQTGLGLYDPTYKISGLPVSEISDVVAKVTFPVFVNIRQDLDRLRTGFFKTAAVTTAVTTLLGLLLFIFAPQVILLVLGPNWLPATATLRILCLSGIAKAVISSIYPLFLATKNQAYVTWVSFTSLVGLGLTIVPFVTRWGLVGAGISATLGSLFALPLAIYYARKILKYSPAL